MEDSIVCLIFLCVESKKLECLASFSLMGNVMSLKCVNLPGAHRDALFLSFSDAKVCDTYHLCPQTDFWVWASYLKFKFQKHGSIFLIFLEINSEIPSLKILGFSIEEGMNKAVKNLIHFMSVFFLFCQWTFSSLSYFCKIIFCVYIDNAMNFFHSCQL